MRNFPAILATAAFAATLFACAAQGAQYGRDGAVIRNSGSTNFAGYTIKVWSDGSVWGQPSGRTGQPMGQPSTAKVPAEVSARFFHDVQASRGGRERLPGPCMKSASFGSSTTVDWHGWSSPDLSCPTQGSLVALTVDVQHITAALGLGHTTMHRVPLMPHEPRRIPTEASPSPEPGAAAS